MWRRKFLWNVVMKTILLFSSKPKKRYNAVSSCRFSYNWYLPNWVVWWWFLAGFLLKIDWIEKINLKKMLQDRLAEFLTSDLNQHSTISKPWEFFFSDAITFFKFFKFLNSNFRNFPSNQITHQSTLPKILCTFNFYCFNSKVSYVNLFNFLHWFFAFFFLVFLSNRKNLFFC